MTTHTSILAQLVLNIVNTSKLKSFHVQRSLVGYSPWGHKELDMTKHTHTHTHIDEQGVFMYGLSVFKNNFGCAGSLLLHGLFSICSKWGLFCSCDTWAQ